MFGSSTEIKQYRKHQKTLAFPVLHQVCCIFSQSREMFWESPSCWGEDSGEKKAYHKAYVGQILSTKDGLISQTVNSELSCHGLPAQHISRKLHALRFGISSLTLLSITALLKPGVQWQGSDLNMFPHESIQNNKYVNIWEVCFLTEVGLTSAV